MLKESFTYFLFFKILPHIVNHAFLYLAKIDKQIAHNNFSK